MWDIFPDKKIIAVYVSKDGCYLSFKDSYGTYSSFILMNRNSGVFNPGVLYKEGDLDAPILLALEYGPNIELELVSKKGEQQC